MKKLSKKEWVAVFAGVAFVAYTLFGGTIHSLFGSGLDDGGEVASATVSNMQDQVITNDILVGSGPEVTSGKLVRLHYVLSLGDGTFVQNSKDFGVPAEFIIGDGGTIPGWEIGLTGMRAGGVRSIVIPPSLGYGAVEYNSIPPNSTLVFTIELLEVIDMNGSMQ